MKLQRPSWTILNAVLAAACLGCNPTAITAAAPAVAQDAPFADVFGALRRADAVPAADYWSAVGAALQKLETLDGASYSPRYGVLTLHGRPAKGYGPFHLDDLMVALQAVYFGDEPLGMTIDPDPKDPHGPEQIVRYMGGCENTAFGWLMFECDRLLKSLSNGQDNLTRQRLAPTVPDFYDTLALSLAMTKESVEEKEEEWNRFWLATDLEKSPGWRKQPEKSDGSQPVLFETADGQAVAFHHCRLYLRTQLMDWQGGKLVPVAGRSSAVAERFAKHFSVHFDEFGQLYPEFARVQALSRLLVLAEWIEKTGLPLDLNYIRHYRQQCPVITPTRTPANTASRKQTTRDGKRIVEREIRSFGGVDLAPRTFFADDVDRAAARQRSLAEEELPRHVREASWIASRDGKEVCVVVLPTARAELRGQPKRAVSALPLRNPGHADPAVAALLPSAPEAAAERPERVPAERITLAALDHYRQQAARPPPEGQPSVTVFFDNRYVPREPSERQLVEDLASLSQPLVAPGGEERPAAVPREVAPLVKKTIADVRARPPPGKPEPAERAEIVPREPAALNAPLPVSNVALPIFRGPRGETRLNLPRLVERFRPNERETMGIEGRAGTSVRVASHVMVASEIGDISVEFDAPQIDQGRAVIFYPAREPWSQRVVGYYPQSRALILRDGGQIAWNEDGTPGQAEMPDGTTVAFDYGPSPLNSEGWPQPSACRVTSTTGRAEAGAYALLRPRAAPSAPPAVRPAAPVQAPASSDAPAPVGPTRATPPRRPTADELFE